jgi:hypothetical protein
VIGVICSKRIVVESAIYQFQAKRNREPANIEIPFDGSVEENCSPAPESDKINQPIAGCIRYFPVIGYPDPFYGNRLHLPSSETPSRVLVLTGFSCFFQPRTIYSAFPS